MPRFQHALAASATILLLIAVSDNAHAARCHVDGAATGTNDGSTWTNAFNDLQSALTDADCSDIWVAAGVYKPTSGTDRATSFSVLPGTVLLGGFAGGETSAEQRDPATNITVLSGDIGANGTAADNSFHVVYLDGSTAAGPILADTLVDGFTITGGMATGSMYPNQDGGGLYCYGVLSSSACSPTIRNMVFQGNHADAGGGAMFNNGIAGMSSPTLEKVVFRDNSATNGGAMANDAFNGGVSSPSLNDVLFEGNDASYLGGAIINNGGNNGTSNPVLRRVTFSNNSAQSGGAIYNGAVTGETNPELTNVTFTGNHADVYGGALYNYATTGTSSPALVNVTFSGNFAWHGGAIRNYANDGASAPSLHNVILWGNTAAVDDQISNEGGTPVVDHSTIEGGCPAGSTCTNLITDDPGLAVLAGNGGFTPTMLPDPYGAAIDSGDDGECPAIDQRGIARPVGLHCDVGAVEYSATADDTIFANGFEAAAPPPAGN